MFREILPVGLMLIKLRVFGVGGWKFSRAKRKTQGVTWRREIYGSSKKGAS